jgi:hypothetical protein
MADSPAGPGEDKGFLIGHGGPFFLPSQAVPFEGGLQGVAVVPTRDLFLVTYFQWVDMFIFTQF